jgi:hypothetical protein
LIICPACGSNVNGDLCLGCPSCGARAVGPPLAQAEHELPSYGRAVLTAVGGWLMAAGFVGALVVALIQNSSGWFKFWTIVSAGEVAAWRLKWAAIPVAVIMVWSSARIVRSIKEDPVRYMGLNAARSGLTAAVAVTFMIALLIGITIPERLRQRALAQEAKQSVEAYPLVRAINFYREIHGVVPPQDDLISELRTVPDPDGSIAAALNKLDVSGYQASAVLASAGNKTKSTALRGGALRNAANNTPLTPDRGGVTFTNYVLRLPGADKILNTEDDLMVKDGWVGTLTEYERYFSSRPHTP